MLSVNYARLNGSDCRHCRASPERLNRHTVLELVKAWTITPLAAGSIAAASYQIGSRLFS